MLSLSLHAGLKHVIEIGLSSSRLLIELLFERQQLQKNPIKFKKTNNICNHTENIHR